MVHRKHRAYMSVNMAVVKENAQLLPERGVPPESVKLLPFDEHLDNIQIQKSATPAEGRDDTAPVAEKLGTRCPNAVVMEKSSQDDADINAQRIAALR